MSQLVVYFDFRISLDLIPSTKCSFAPLPLFEEHTDQRQNLVHRGDQGVDLIFTVANITTFDLVTVSKC